MDKNLIREVKSLKISREVNKKLKEFKKNFNIKPEQKFIELCFCILVANTSIEKTLQSGEKFLKTLSISQKIN